MLGRDYAGVVEQADRAVGGYRPGDHAFRFLLHANPTVHSGAWAELITVAEELSIAPVPDGVDLAVADAAPLAGITAMTALDALDLSGGDVLLVPAPAVAPAAWPSSSPRVRGPDPRPGAAPRTRPSRASTASATCSRATATSPSPCATWSPTGRRAAGPRQLRAGQLRRRAQARRSRRLAHRRRRRGGRAGPT